MTKLVKHKKADLVEITDEKILANYLLQFRKILETNGQIRNVVVNSDPAIEAKPKLMRMLADQCKPGSEKLFKQAIDILLTELDEFRRKPSSLYLVDEDTGKAIMPITDDLVFTPPDYVGEDGLLHKSKPTLHPGITASLALAVYGKAKIKKHLQKATDSISKQAYKHLSGPEQILEMVKERFDYLGIEIIEAPDRCDQTIEFGREQVEGVMQSPNIRFHRAHMFAAVLAHKLLKLGGRSARYFVGSITNEKNTKQTWYTVEVGVESYIS
jgi:hypothetical protein